MQDIWEGHDHTEVNVHGGDEAALEFELSKLDSLHEPLRGSSADLSWCVATIPFQKGERQWISQRETAVVAVYGVWYYHMFLAG